MSNQRRVSSWRILGRLAAGTVALALAFGGWAVWSTGRAWDELARRGRQAADREASRPLRRVALRPFDRPGDAWSDYQAALDALRSVPVDDDALLMFFVRNEIPRKLDRVRSALVPYASALGLLARGVRRAGFSPANRPRLLSVDKPRWDHQWLRLAVAGLCQGRVEEDPDGEGAPGVAWIREVLQLSRDVAEVGGQDSAGFYMGILLLVRDQLGVLLEQGRLGPAQAGVLEAVLNRLAEEAPDVEALLQRDLAIVLQDAYRRGESSGWGGMRRAGLGHLFSARRNNLAYARLAEDTVRRSQGSEAWPAAEVLIRKEEAYARGDWDASALCFQGIMILRTAQAEIRVMQAALAWRLRGTIPLVADPCGTTLHASVRDGVLTVWSNGWNFVDDHAGGSDIVMRVKRAAP